MVLTPNRAFDHHGSSLSCAPPCRSPTAPMFHFQILYVESQTVLLYFFPLGRLSVPLTRIAHGFAVAEGCNVIICPGGPGMI